ncbi:YqzL family protein [Paenibacillus thermoaerophilus]|jgi:hypothetical protein|uniref:YqzL family protein n=1 Tax=Paenibacillus thermoaerophilus TaxID=1215385 RepID=A0ABW2V2X4_9BACL|nr:YqzL family protein [Paenibacillus thermoaerophilus]TMV19031.1 YqzL family protein [Paenibacillus thermoaerophilus]
MRDFSWKYFAMTGDLESYLLYKESRPAALTGAEAGDDGEWPEDDGDWYSDNTR